LRDRIQRICLAHRSYGYRRVLAALRKQGFPVIHKKVRRLMREDNLLAVRRRKWVATTDSRHQLAVFPNLAPWIEPDGSDQLWVADLTYIRLRSEFVYLAVVLDAWSRRVVGWALGRDLTASLPKRALLNAIAERHPEAGLVHHSDRGVQYASLEYVAVLQEHQIIGSMSRSAYPYDNARCESFMRTLKREEIHCRRYSTMDELRSNLEQFIECYYNQERLHSALDYRSPAEFEASEVA
jgi:transposase InsO family protein